MLLNHIEADFHSIQYKKINWANTLKKCYERKSSDFPYILSSHSWTLVPICHIQLEKIYLQLPSRVVLVKAQDLKCIANNFLDACGIKVARITDDLSISEIVCENNYFKLCEDICYEFLNYSKNILTYTCEHLSERISEKMCLIDRESVQLTIAKVICELDSAESLLNTFSEIQILSEANHYILQALERLAKLGGGRAMLRGNAIELLFHLRLFQSIFLSRG